MRSARCSGRPAARTGKQRERGTAEGEQNPGVRLYVDAGDKGPFQQVDAGDPADEHDHAEGRDKHANGCCRRRQPVREHRIREYVSCCGRFPSLPSGQRFDPSDRRAPDASTSG